MDRVTIKLTVLYEEPFWVGIYERTVNEEYDAAKVVFWCRTKRLSNLRGFPQKLEKNCISALLLSVALQWLERSIPSACREPFSCSFPNRGSERKRSRHLNCSTTKISWSVRSCIGKSLRKKSKSNLIFGSLRRRQNKEADEFLPLFFVKCRGNR